VGSHFATLPTRRFRERGFPRSSPRYTDRRAHMIKAIRIAILTVIAYAVLFYLPGF